MEIANRAMIDGFLGRNAAARKPMDRWVKIVLAGQWTDIVEMRNSFLTADVIKGTNLICFNIGGNNYRLIGAVSYQRQQIVIHELLTHAEYDKKHAR